VALAGAVATPLAFVCADTDPPHDHATKEMTDQYNLQFRFFGSSNFIIKKLVKV
jgi:hypothetical protein